MKIAITGHSRGFGKAVATYFESKGHTVLGFSRSNGYDITNGVDQKRILEEIKDCDIFINNAYAPGSQLHLLNEAISLWDNTTKTIVNIDSKSTFMNSIPQFMEEYVRDKGSQKSLIMKRVFKARPHILNFTIGLVDTDMAKVFDSRKMNPSTLAEFLYMLIEYKDQVAVQDILVEVPDLNWDDIKRV